MTSRGYCPQFEVLEDRTMLTSHTQIEHHKPPQELKHLDQTIKIEKAEKAEDRSHLQYCIAIPVEHKARGGTVLTEPQKKWLQALRGDKFKQCQGRLHEDGGYCCLGVACEIFAEELRLQKEVHFLDGEEGCVFYNGCGTFLPKEVQNHLKLRSGSGEFEAVGETGETKELTTLNDDGKTFAEIADIIEQNAEKLFYE